MSSNSANYNALPWYDTGDAQVVTSFESEPDIYRRPGSGVKVYGASVSMLRLQILGISDINLSLSILRYTARGRSSAYHRSRVLIF
jgi:hypothetical protein